MSIFILGIIAVAYTLENQVDEDKDIKTRVESVNNFVFSMEEDLERQLYTAGYRAIFIAEDNISREGRYIEDFEDFFLGAVINGTGTKNSSDVMEGAKISDIKENIKRDAEKMNVEINFSNTSVSVGQESPWNVRITMNFSYVIEDKSGLASWEGSESVFSDIGITNFEDPIYTLETGGALFRKFHQTPYEGNYSSGEDVSHLEEHIENKYYAANNRSPDFMSRFEGSFSADENGVESFVNIPDMDSQNLDTEEKSCLDYIYFSNESPPYETISGLPEWVKIDDDHLKKYQVENLTK
ncbi:MAG: hypothetical protein ACLFT4_08915 [Bacteroidales bacterium]